VVDDARDALADTEMPQGPDGGVLSASLPLAAALHNWAMSHGVADIEGDFVSSFVSNPYAGAIVKGHCIVLAELGLAPFDGTITRVPTTFLGGWSRERRAEHVCVRIAFVRAVFARLGVDRVTLYRGVSSPNQLGPHPARTLVSTTFDRAVALSHFDGFPDGTAALYRQSVPVERVLMTYLETAAMNDRYRESEAVLLATPGNLAF
jgi:hypothetical protein